MRSWTVVHTLGETFEVKGTVMPGSSLEHITSLARREISHLHRNNFVVIMGGRGANDISKNESNIGLQLLRKFALRNEHTNIIAINSTAQVWPTGLLLRQQRNTSF